MSHSTSPSAPTMASLPLPCTSTRCCAAGAVAARTAVASRAMREICCGCCVLRPPKRAACRARVLLPIADHEAGMGPGLRRRTGRPLKRRRRCAGRPNRLRAVSPGRVPPKAPRPVLDSAESRTANRQRFVLHQGSPAEA
jgi:hypothetical protein